MGGKNDCVHLDMLGNEVIVMFAENFRNNFNAIYCHGTNVARQIMIAL